MVLFCHGILFYSQMQIDKYMEKGLVSIIIPSHGGAEFLGRCIESALAQTYQKIEVIVVDDNGIGTKNQIVTAKVMSHYQNDDRVKYICHKVNINGSAARNTGVKNSLGEYVALLDDDDVFLKDKIKRQFCLLSSLPMEYGAVYCSHETFLKGNKVGEEHANLDGKILYDYMIHRVEIASSSIMIRRSVWEELEGFDESFSRHQDWEFISRLLNKYAIKSDDFYGFKRILQFRNSKVSPKIVKERRLFYLYKMSSLINSFPKEERETLLVQELFDVAITFLKAKDFKGFVKEFLTIRPRRIAFKTLFHKFCCFIKRGGKIIK